MTRQNRALAGPLLAALLAAPVSAQETQPKAPPVDPRPTYELSLQDAVARTLENNVDIAVERFNPEASQQDVRARLGVYDPFFAGLLRRSSETRPAQNIFAGAASPESDLTLYNFNVNQYLPTGGSLDVSFDNAKQSTNAVIATFNPSYSSSLSLALTQPLLRNFRLDNARYNLKVARKNLEISEIQFRQTVINTVATVRQQYYDLIYAIDNLDAQRKSLALAQKLLDENQIKVRVGTMAPLDVVFAESEVAGREAGVIAAEAAVLDAEDALKRSVFKQHDTDNWGLRVVPTDRPTADPSPVDAEAALKNALEKRTDVVAARKRLENAELAITLTRSQVLPQVDLIASYGAAGLGGTQLRDANGEALPVPIPGGYGDAVSDVFGRDFPTWAVGVNFSYPFGNRQAAASRAQAQIAKEQSLASLRRLEMQIAVEVRSAARAVESNLKLVESSRAARVLQERRLDAEQKRFNAGMSTNFFVTQAQRDLQVAEVQELQSIANYRKSLVNFERVQEAGGGVLFTTSQSVQSSAAATLRATSINGNQ